MEKIQFWVKFLIFRDIKRVYGLKFQDILKKIFTSHLRNRNLKISTQIHSKSIFPQLSENWRQRLPKNRQPKLQSTKNPHFNPQFPTIKTEKSKTELHPFTSYLKLLAHLWKISTQFKSRLLKSVSPVHFNTEIEYYFLMKQIQHVDVLIVLVYYNRHRCCITLPQSVHLCCTMAVSVLYHLLHDDEICSHHTY